MKDKFSPKLYADVRDAYDNILDTDISTVTEIDTVNDNIIGHMTEVERILSDKLNLIIDSHRIIIDRLDRIQEEIERCIMQRLDVDGKRK